MHPRGDTSLPATLMIEELSKGRLLQSQPRLLGVLLAAEAKLGCHSRESEGVLAGESKKLMAVVVWEGVALRLIGASCNVSWACLKLPVFPAFWSRPKARKV